MSRIIRWGLSAVGLLIALVLVLPFVLPASVYKEQVIQAARQSTGRELAIDGDLSVSFWPTLGVVADKVRFANAPGAVDSDMVTMESLVVGAELFPLLSGTLNVTQITLVNPVINLEVDRQGRGNWVLQQEHAAGAQAPPAGEAGNGNFSFRNVELTGGVLTYRDAGTGASERIEAINALVRLPSLDEPMSFSGELTWNKEAITLTADLANPRLLTANGQSGLTAKVEGKLLTTSFTGNAGKGGITGVIDLRTDSARGLASWVGLALPGAQGFGALTLSGDMSASRDGVTFKKAKLSLDGMSGSGELKLTQANSKPYVKGSFALDRLDLNAYLGVSAAVGSPGGNAGVAAWSDAPIDVAPLKLVNADLDFSVDALTAGKLKIGRSVLAIVISGGKLRTNLKQIELYGGTGHGLMSLQEVPAGSLLALDLVISGVQAEPFLTDAMGFQKLTGLGSVTVRVAASGRSQRSWMQSLGGSARFQFVDGTIKGINLAEIARTISSAVTGAAVGDSATTDFSELSGSYVIKGGVAANKDLKLSGPFVRMDGAGLIDIGNQAADYRVAPKAVPSAQGQGGKHDLGGLGIPFRIKGPWTKLSYEPDLTGVANSTIDAILKGKNPLDGLKGDGGFGELIQGFGDNKSSQDGTTSGAPPPTQEPKKETPLDPLKDIFGGGQ